MTKGHAERIYPLIGDLLAEAGARLDEIAVFAALRGPGSFTGVRIGVAAVRALAMGAGARAVGVDGFFAAAETAWARGARAEVAAAVFGKPASRLSRRFALGSEGVSALTDIEGFDPDDAPALLIGPGAASVPPAIEISVVARLAAAGGPAVGPPAPLYIRPPDATPSREIRPTRLGPRPE